LADSKVIVILKMGDLSKISTDNYEQLIIKGTGLDKKLFQVHDIPAGDPLPEADVVKAIIITGSSMMLTDDHDWKEAVNKWICIQVSRQVPILGICFGHQILADALGGKIGDNPLGLELGTKLISLNPTSKDDVLMRDYFPELLAQVSHVQSVIELPEDSTVLASSNLEPYQAVRFAENVWGLQFHPEFDATLMSKIIRNKAATGKFQIDADLIISELKETENSFSILQKFGQIILQA
jgi:GMP synthase (glutamine-hydrolysing)